MPIDGSKQSYGGLMYALRSFLDGTFTTLYVIDIGRELYEGPWFSRSREEQAHQAAEEVQDQATEWAAQYGIELEQETTVGVPHKQILEYVVNHDVDQIVMGSHGRSGLSRVLVGSVAETVAHCSPIPVTIVRE